MNGNKAIGELGIGKVWLEEKEISGMKVILGKLNRALEMSSMENGGYSVTIDKSVI